MNKSQVAFKKIYVIISMSIFTEGFGHAGAALLGKPTGQNGLRANKACPADDSLAVLFAKIVDQIIELGLLFVIHGIGNVKQAILPLSALLQPGSLYAELAQRRHAVPRFVKDLAGHAEQLLGAVRGRRKRLLVGKGLKFLAA